MARKKPAMRRRFQGFGSMLLVAVVVVMVIVIINIQSVELRSKLSDYEAREAYLLERIEEQKERRISIDEYSKYMTTKQYIEDMARAKYGLVYPDEIIFETK